MKISFILILILIILVVIVITVQTTLSITSSLKKSKLKKRFSKGLKGEEYAKLFLLKNNYKIIGEQVSKDGKMYIDDELHVFKTRVDYIAEKKGERILVEVKSGNTVNNPLYTDTRRQLLEYYHQYNADKIFLFDSENNKLLKISFPISNKGIAINKLYYMFLGLLGSSLFFIFIHIFFY